MYGDIILGTCSEEEKIALFEHIKEKCSNGIKVYLKFTSTGEYYLSVPIQSPDDFPIKSSYYYQPFHFVDLYCPPDITCVTYSTEKECFISNVDIEGCSFSLDEYDDDIECDEESLYEITLYDPELQLPVSNETDLLAVTKQLLLNAW